MLSDLNPSHQIPKTCLPRYGAMAVAIELRAGGPGEQARWLECTREQARGRASGGNFVAPRLCPVPASLRISMSKQYASYRGSNLARNGGACR